MYNITRTSSVDKKGAKNGGQWNFFFFFKGTPKTGLNFMVEVGYFWGLVYLFYQVGGTVFFLKAKNAHKTCVPLFS